MADLVIRNEEEAYAALQKATNHALPRDTRLVFENWQLSIVLRGEEFDASLTMPIMQGLIEFQKGLYRSFAAVKYGSPTKRLSDEEKKALQLSIKVEAGSTDLNIPFEELGKHLITELTGKMQPEYLLISVLGIALMYFGSSFLKTLLDNRKEVRLKEVTDETQRATLEAMRFSSQQETERTKIITQAMARVPNLEAAAAAATEAHSEIVKSASTAASSEIAGVRLEKEAALTLVHNARQQSQEARLDGRYRLLRLDWSDPTSFKVKVFRLADGLELDAEVQDDTLTGEYKDLLKAAEWNREPVLLSINAKRIGETYKNAVIVQVQALPKQDSASA